MKGKGHKYVTSGPSAFRVKLNAQTNVYAMDEMNWSSLRRGGSFRYVDGVHATHNPAVVHVPHAGSWVIFVEAVPGRSLQYEIQPI